MKNFLTISGIIMLCLLGMKLLRVDKSGEEVVTEEKVDAGTLPTGLAMYEPDLSHVTFADTARILDSLYAEREHLCSPTTCCINLGWEIAVRLIIDSLDMEKANAILPHHMHRNDLRDFQKEMDRFYDITLNYYNKLDSTDPWNHFYTSCDLLEKVIKPHTMRYKQSY